MNKDIVKLARQEIVILQSNIQKGNHLKTGDIHMPRVSFRYAIEKMDYEKRQYLMQL